MKYYQPFTLFGMTLDTYLVFYWVEVDENTVFGFTSVYRNDQAEASEYHKHLLNVIKSVRVNGNPVDTGKLTPKKLEKALDLDAKEDADSLDLGLSIGINFKNGDEETNYTLNSDGSITEETTAAEGNPDDADDTEDPVDENGVLNTLRIGDSYEQSFLHEHGKDIKRMIVTGYGYVNYITLSECPNVEEFIVDNNSAFTFEDGVLYSQKGNTRTIEYVTKNVKHLHIDADVTDVSSYWHGVDEVTVDPGNSTFVVQDNMLLSRRKNSLYFVTSKAKEVVIPEGVTQIHNRAFQYCENLKKVVFPASYNWDGWYASNADPVLITHENMKDAEIIINGDKARYENQMVVVQMWSRIEPKLYLGDRKLCRIPADMTSTFGFGQAFAYVENFEVSKDNPALSSVDGVILDKSGEKLEFYPRTRKNFVIPDSVNEIVSHSAANCNELTEITIPARVKKIGQMAFANCICLSKVTTLNPDAEVHEQAYFGCHDLNGDGFAEPVDEEELKKSLAKEIRDIRKANKKNKNSTSAGGSGLFGFGLFNNAADKEVRIDDEDNRKVIVDDKWSFRLPDGLELRFDSEHVDIMGSTSTAQYVVEGAEHNGRFFFDFELRQRFDDGMSTDVDVIGCRHDNDVTSGNAQQRIIKDDDDLYVDIVNKPVFFFNSMISIRVRGDDIRSWDFTAGVKSSDEEISARWDEVKSLINELAGSIELLNTTGKSKKKAKKAQTADPDFIIANGVLRKYTGGNTSVVIPEGVKEIADSAFSGFSKLKSVVVPEGVKKIGRRCFENCIRLRSCNLPESLEEVGGYAFVDCHELKKVYLSDKIKSLGDSTFSECFALKDVKLPKKIKEIDAFAFKNCDSFKHIVIPEGVTSIGLSAFVSCDDLEYLFIPKSVTDIQKDFMNNHPFAGSEKMIIFTPEGSYAEKFAVENGIPYKNTAKGEVTADNTSAKTGSAEAQSQSGKSVTGDDGLTYATPDDSLYPHYDSKKAPSGLGLFGINVVTTHSGTDYQFFHMSEDIGEDASEEFRAAASSLTDTGAAGYKLADVASEMKSVFHVSPDIFDFRHDKECEIDNDLMQSAYMMSGLRSFAWTLSKYCDDKKTEPSKLSLDEIRRIVDFVSDREWLNYDGDSYCKSLCGTSDVHVFYVPDNTPESVKAKFVESEKDLEEAQAMKDQFPSYNPIFSQIGSLDGLRKDLEYIYPAIEKIYEDIKSSRDFNEPLTGNDADILYAWCALAYAARAPFFSEDGPTMYMHIQIKSEEELQAEYEERRRKAIEDRAEMSKKFMASYGKYFEKDPKIVFTDKKFVFTGMKARKFEIDDNTDYTGLIEKRGGLTRSKVSGVTDYLVVDPAGAGESKISEAIDNQKKGKPIKIILLDDLMRALGLDVSEVSAPVKAEDAPAAAPKATAKAAKQPAQNKVKAKNPASQEKTVTVDNTWVVTIPAGFKYSTDKSVIGDHRNIIFMEDKDDNMFEWPFDASISFTSAFNDSQDNPATMMAKLMTGFMSNGNEVVLKDEEDIYVVYWYDKNRSDNNLQIFQIQVGCGKGVSGIQVFFNDSELSRREQTKLVEKVAKSIRLVGEAASYSSIPTASTGLTAEQQRQKDELNRQIEDLKSQAAYYTSRSDELSAEDQATLAEAKEEIANLGKQIDEISTDQAKFGEFLKHKEERERKQEEERQRRIAEAKAAGQTEDDLINMYVILCNERKLNSPWEKTQKEFYEAYKEYFPAYKTRELGALKKEIKEKIKDKEVRRHYAESFMKRSVKDRYDVVTDSYFSLDRYADYTLRSEDAIIKTSEWYTPEEMSEVRKLMNEQHDKDCKGADDAFDPVEKKWKKYWSAREFLKIVIRDVTDEEISNGVRKDCRLFQTQVGLGFLGTVVVEVSLSTKGLLQLSTPVMNFFPHYWSTTPKDIWETARQNQIDDNSTVYIDDINEVVQNAIRRIKEEHKESYPDYKTTLNSWNSAINRKANRFAGYIAKLYKDTDQHFTAAEIKEKLKESFATAHELGEAKEKLFQLTKMDGLDLLAEILSERSEIKDIYDSLPKRLAENIKEVRKEKIFAANEAKYAEAVKHYESNDPKVIQKAEEAFASLGSFKDAKTLLKHCSTRLEGARSKQYDEAISLKADGTENSINRAIEILSGLGAYKDAQQKVSEYKKELERRHKLEEIKTLSQSNSLTDLSRAIKMLEEFRAESANAEALINQCSSKIESIKVERYAEAISLAEEGTESSINSAILKMEAIDPYKDSGDRIAQFRKQLENEKAYLSAVEHVNDSDFGELEVAKVIFEQLGDYKDSAEKAVACDKRAEELKENMYLEARSAEKTYSLKSQTEALALYRKLGDYKDSVDRQKKCDEKCEIIRDIHSLNKEIETHKTELSALKGAFKGKERKAKEAQISSKEQRVAELKDKLTNQYKEKELKATEEEKLAELDVTASANAAQSPSANQISAPSNSNVAAAASGTPKKKKSKAGIIIAILIILALLAVGFVKIALPRIIINQYIDSYDEEDETVQEITPEFEAANVLSFEEVSRDVTEFDTGKEITYIYKVTNNSDKSIWGIESELRFYDASGKTLCDSWDSYRGNLEPGKWAYIEAISSLQGKSVDLVDDIGVKSYSYYIDNQSYTLNLKTNSYESYSGVMDDLGNTDFNSANILDVELEDSLHLEDGLYITRATVTNNSKENLKDVYVGVEFLDEDGNSIERTNCGIDLGPEPGKSATIEIYCHSDYADKVKSINLTDYEYFLKKKDANGFNEYTVYPPMNKAYGMEY